MIGENKEIGSVVGYRQCIFMGRRTGGIRDTIQGIARWRDHLSREDHDMQETLSQGASGV